jgi:hypothetical protein
MKAFIVHVAVVCLWGAPVLKKKEFVIVGSSVTPVLGQIW